MASQSNIISIGEVKRSSRQRSGQNVSSVRSARKPQRAQMTEEKQERGKHAASAAKSVRSAAQDRKKKRAKARADKMFDRQMAASQRAASDEGAPRAAVYKADMGNAHRRSTRMQRASEAGSWTAKINPAGWFSNISITPGRARVITAVLCVVLAVAFLYTPAQQYYQSVREHDRLQAEYEAIYDRNVALDRQNETLASDAGMEDAVRERYGYIVEGEEMARVSGLSETALAREGNDDIEANVLSSSVKAPEEWYTPILDAFFGVK